MFLTAYHNLILLLEKKEVQTPCVGPMVGSNSIGVYDM